MKSSGGAALLSPTMLQHRVVKGRFSEARRWGKLQRKVLSSCIDRSKWFMFVDIAGQRVVLLLSSDGKPLIMVTVWGHM